MTDQDKKELCAVVCAAADKYLREKTEDISPRVSYVVTVVVGNAVDDCFFPGVAVDGDSQSLFALLECVSQVCDKSREAIELKISGACLK